MTHPRVLTADAGARTPSRGPRRLRTRIVARIGTLVATLSVLLGSVTYFVVRDVLVDEREQSAAEQFSTNAVIVRSALRSDDVDPIAVLSSLRPEVRARELLFTDGEWFTASLQVQPDDLPAELVAAVASGQPSSQRFSVDGTLVQAIGAELADDSLYFEVFSFSDIRTTLGTLRNALIAAGTLATLGGMVGAWWIGKRIARPLEEVSAAAAGIAAGDLTTRLDSRADAEVARIAESFNRMANSLQTRIERESRFAADVSHELRSPLTTLVNTVSVLERRRAELSPEADEALTLLAGDVSRFERMVADLIEISKHDAGSARIDLDEVEVGDAVRRLVRRLGYPDLPVSVDPAAEGEIMRVDVQRLGVAFRNVLENADSYGGGPTEVRVEVHDDHVVVTIDDRGPGIAPHERERVFERFARGEHGERRQTADGSGLGLALARENLSAMGGTIQLDVPPTGIGARFTLRLPRVVT